MEYRDALLRIKTITDELFPDIPPNIPKSPPKPTKKYKLIDGKQPYSKITSGRKPWLSFYNKKNITVRYLKIRNHGRIFIKNCSGMTFEFIDADYFYGFYLENSSGNTFRNITASHGRKIFSLIKGSKDNTFLNVRTSKGHSPSSGSNQNGDGGVVEGGCDGNKFINFYGEDHRDACLDLKSNDNIVTNLVSIGCRNGVKLWGKRNVFLGKTVIKDATDYGWLQIRGDTKVNHVTFINSGDYHIKMGLKKYRTSSRSLEINKGTYDNSAKLLHSPYSNSKFKHNLVKV